MGILPSVIPARLSGAAAGIVEDDKRGNAQVVMNHDYDWTPGRVTVPASAKWGVHIYAPYAKT